MSNGTSQLIWTWLPQGLKIPLHSLEEALQKIKQDSEHHTLIQFCSSMEMIYWKPHKRLGAVAPEIKMSCL